MSGFKRTVTTGIATHAGDPHCDAAHAALLAGLQSIGTPFLKPPANISLSQKGNLGEYISLHVAVSGELKGTEKFVHNAIRPLERISGAGVDLMYVYFDPLDESGDLLYLQEVKTTGATNLNLFSALEKDFEKLFSLDLNKNLQARVQGLANSFEIERNNDEYAARVLKLAATQPKGCERVRLIPTGISNLGVGDPTQKLLGVRSTITALGWSQSAVNPWSIVLSDLEDRLLRLARGQL